MAALIVLFEREPAPEQAEEALRRAGLHVARSLVDGRALRVRAEGSDAELALMGAPLDGTRLAEAAAHSAWEEADAAIARHEAHARLSLPTNGEQPPLERLEALSRMAGALLDLPGAIALFDDVGGALTEGPVAARRLAGSMPTPPLDLWVSVRTFELADARGGFLDTLGMSQLGLPDLEAYAGEGAATATMSAWLRNVCLYLVQEDELARLRHGDTLDGPDEQPWVTQEDVATVEPSRPVLRFVPIRRAAR